jgi:hypothetical protein
VKRIILSLILVLSLASCSKDTSNKFDGTDRVSLNELVKNTLIEIRNYQTALASAEMYNSLNVEHKDGVTCFSYKGIDKCEYKGVIYSPAESTTWCWNPQTYNYQTYNYQRCKGQS